MGTYVTQLLSAGGGAQWLALLAAFVWGILSVALSPCHLAVIPLVVGLVSGQARTGTPRAFAIALSLALGTLVSFTAIGALVAFAGVIIGELAWLETALAVVFIAVGLNLIGVLPLPHFHPHFHAKGSGLFPAFALGLLYGCAHGPCCLAFMAPLVTVALGTAASSALFAALLLVAFGLGHSAVIMLTGTAAGTMQRYFAWSENKRFSIVLSRVSGALVLLAGIYMLAEPWLPFSG
jgi:cytochrome c-type biogenesis protein